MNDVIISILKVDVKSTDAQTTDTGRVSDCSE